MGSTGGPWASNAVHRTLRKRMVLTGVLLVVLPLCAVFATVYLQNEKMTHEAREISQTLTQGELKNVVEHLYALAETHRRTSELRVRHGRSVASHLLGHLGPPSHGEGSPVDWVKREPESDVVTPVKLPRLRFGHTELLPGRARPEQEPITNALDEIHGILDLSCTLFQRVDAEGNMLVVATTARNKTGERRVGELLSAKTKDESQSRIVTTLLRGDAYVGRAFSVDSAQVTGYMPLFDEAHHVIGAINVGMAATSTDELRRAILDVVIGKTGYAFVIDRAGRYVVSKNAQRDGEMIAGRTDLPGSDIDGLIKKAMSLRPGESAPYAYRWSNNPGDPLQPKLSYIMYFEPWQWVIGAGTYEHEVLEPSLRVAAIGHRSNMVLGGVFVAALAASIFLWILLAGDIAKPLTEINHRLTHTVEQLEMGRREIIALNELGNLLLHSTAEDEMYALVIQTCQRLFPNDAGSLAILDPESERLCFVGRWGMGQQPSPTEYSREACWAVRRGKMHIVTAGSSAPRCEHSAHSNPEMNPDANYNANADMGTACVPMSADGLGLGALCLHLLSGEPDETVSETLAKRAGQMSSILERLAPCLTNIRLRETLRTQSIRDPLTGLYNRRHMEEFLTREVHRAERHRTSIALMMLDLDHFKTFNDTHGHDAGDTALRSIGDLLGAASRGEDLACRYGGEEFTVILPGLDAEHARARAEEIRRMIRSLAIRYRGATHAITVSIGVALYPKHGSTIEHVLKAADLALYRAKAAGRDCVVVANDPAPHDDDPTGDENAPAVQPPSSIHSRSHSSSRKKGAA